MVVFECDGGKKVEIAKNTSSDLIDTTILKVTEGKMLKYQGNELAWGMAENIVTVIGVDPNDGGQYGSLYFQLISTNGFKSVSDTDLSEEEQWEFIYDAWEQDRLVDLSIPLFGPEDVNDMDGLWDEEVLSDNEVEHIKEYWDKIKLLAHMKVLSFNALQYASLKI